MTKLQQFIREVLIERIRTENSKFDIRQFKQINDANQAYQYASSRLSELGSGSSRKVYTYSSGKVLKIVNVNSNWPTAGIGQNELEVKVFDALKPRVIVPKIYDHHPDYLWIISELANPIANYDYKKMLAALGIKRNRGFKADRLFWDLISMCESGEHSYGIIVKILVKNEFEYNEQYLREFVEGVSKLFTDFNLYKEDVKVSLNWGLNVEGRLLLLDSGFSDEVSRKHYGGSPDDD